jgi:DNA-binding LytR/AlgR family response regulator
MLFKRSYQPPAGATVPDMQENIAVDTGERYERADRPSSSQDPAPTLNRAHYPRDLSIFLKEKHGLRRVLITDILFVIADGNYVELHMPHGRVVLRNSICELLRSMPKDIFFMVNRSQAVNILLVDQIGTDEISIGKRSFTLTRRYREDLLRDLNIIASR